MSILVEIPATKSPVSAHFWADTHDVGVVMIDPVPKVAVVMLAHVPWIVPDHTLLGEAGLDYDPFLLLRQVTKHKTKDLLHLKAS